MVTFWTFSVDDSKFLGSRVAGGELRRRRCVEKNAKWRALFTRSGQF
jgi:hypothetical protein